MVFFRPFALCIIIPVLLSGCSKHDSYDLVQVCSHATNVGGPNCCALGRDYPGEPENFTPYSFSCTNTAEECKAGVGGNLNAFRFPLAVDSRYHDNAQFNSGCAATSWSKKFVGAAKTFVARLAVKSVPIAEQLDCRKSCDYDFMNGANTGNPGDCPSVKVNADVVGALFSFYSSVDPSSYTDDTTFVPMSTIAKQFSISAIELQACPRTDVVVEKSGRVQNTGQKCDSAISFDDQGNEVASTLSIASLLAGNVIQSDENIRWMEYSPNSTFSLTHADETYNKLFGGYVARSGMLYDAAIAEVVNKDNYKSCIRAQAPLSVTSADFSVGKVPAVALEQAMKSLVKSVAAYYNSNTTDLYPGLSDAVLKLKTEEATTLKKDLSAQVSSAKVDDAFVASLAEWMDAGLCHQTLMAGGKFNIDFVRAYDEAFVYGKPVQQRNFARARLLRCAFVSHLVPQQFLEVLNKVAPKQ